jgi:hypothetical protein
LLRKSRMVLAAFFAIAAVAVLPATASADLIPPTADTPSVDFGSLPVGKQSPPIPITLTETCTSLNCLGAILPDQFAPVLNVTSGFTQTSNCPLNLLALLGLPVTCKVDVVFVPTLVGKITGLLTTGGGGPSVALNGVGTPASASGSKRRKCKKHHKKHHRALAVKFAKRCKKHK